MGILQSVQIGQLGRKVMMAGGTFAIAIGAGIFMQNGMGQAPSGKSGQASIQQASLTIPATAAGQAQVAPPPAAVTTAGFTPTPMISPRVEDTTQSLATPAVADVVASDQDAPYQMNAAVTADLAAVDLAEDPPVLADLASVDIAVDGNSAPSLSTDAASAQGIAQGADCEPSMAAKPIEAALVSLTIAAPCHAAQSLTIHHEGMMFTATTDASGTTTVVAPALSEAAMFIAAFNDGLGAVAEATVADMVGYDRVIVQWQGQAGFEMHAMEFGANYGEAGHVWREAARDAQAALDGKGGFLMPLGDINAAAPLLAEVYTFPSGTAPAAGTIKFSVEAEVTATNCATDVSAQTLELGAKKGVRIADLTLSMPECAAIGEFMVLRDILNDLTLAQG